jgi:putative ABC transport system ATP-binding protein
MLSKLFRINEQKNINGLDAPIDVSHLVDLRDVVKEYDTPAGKFCALGGVNLKVDGGEFVAVIGKSGSGKSTLTNMITGIDRPTSGEVVVAGTAVHKMNEGQIAVWRGRTVGVVFQFFQLLPTLTVVENVMLPMDFGNMYTDRERRERALHLLEQVDMAEQADKMPTAISGGQQQRAAIARSLANDPPMIVADEPTGNLDSKTADAVFNLFEELVDGGKTILMVTHDDDLASRVTRAVTIADGLIVSDEQRALLSMPEVAVIPVNGNGNGHGKLNGRDVPVKDDRIATVLSGNGSGYRNGNGKSHANGAGQRVRELAGHD